MSNCLSEIGVTMTQQLVIQTVAQLGKDLRIIFDRRIFKLGPTRKLVGKFFYAVRHSSAQGGVVIVLLSKSKNNHTLYEAYYSVSFKGHSPEHVEIYDLC